MNKQELIEILEELKESAKRNIEIDNHDRYGQGKAETYAYAIGLAQQLDEPQKQELTDEEVLELVSTHFRFDKDNFWEQLKEMSMLPDQLDEPQKQVVPKCAEEWLEGHCAASDVINLFIEVTCATDSDGFISDKWRWSGEFYDWLVEDSDTLYILCDAFRYGYEVEKEPLYVMPIPHVSFPIHYCVKDDHISFRQGNAQKFTQAELDKYFPDIKQLAVPVDEVEG